MMTMKELCAHVKNTNLERARKHRLEVTKGDYCSGLTAKEYNRVRIKSKGAGGKGRSFSHNKLWESQKYSNHIHTMYYDGTFTK